MPKFMIGARGHDFGRQTPEQLFQAIGEAGFACTQLAYTKAIQGVSSYGDVTPALVAETQDAIQKSGVQAAVYGTYVELSYADEERRRAETAKVLGQSRNAKLLGSVCMGSETTSMSKQPGVTRREAQEALLRSLAEDPARLRGTGRIVWRGMCLPPCYEHPGGGQDGTGHHGQPQSAGDL